MYTKDQILSAERPLAKQMLFANLVLNDAWLARALLALHRRQTPQEQRIQETLENNQRGFNSCDAKFLSSLAVQAQQWHAGHRTLLMTVKQKQRCIPAMRKYCGQLLRVARGE